LLGLSELTGIPTDQVILVKMLETTKNWQGNRTYKATDARHMVILLRNAQVQSPFPILLIVSSIATLVQTTRNTRNPNTRELESLT
jgi:hypothetical protein